MAYPDRDWDNTGTKVTKEDFKRMETGIKNNDNQINVLSGGLTHKTPKDVADLTATGLYQIYGDGSTRDGFTYTQGYLYNLNVFSTLYGGSNPTVTQIITCSYYNVVEKGMYYRTFYYAGGWSAWRQIATTATTTLPLPVASGFINFNNSSYVKKTNNVIEVAIGVKKGDNGVFGSNTVIATLPVGYRPSRGIVFSLRGISSSTTNGLCYGAIQNTGDISLRSDSSFQEVQGIVSFTIG